VLRGVIHPRQALCLGRAHRLDQALRPDWFVWSCRRAEIAACRAQPLRQRLPLPVLVLLAIGKGALHALLQLIQLPGLALQLLRGMHQATLQVVTVCIEFCRRLRCARCRCCALSLRPLSKAWRSGADALVPPQWG